MSKQYVKFATPCNCNTEKKNFPSIHESHICLAMEKRVTTITESSEHVEEVSCETATKNICVRSGKRAIIINFTL